MRTCVARQQRRHREARRLHLRAHRRLPAAPAQAVNGLNQQESRKPRTVVHRKSRAPAGKRPWQAPILALLPPAEDPSTSCTSHQDSQDPKVCRAVGTWLHRGAAGCIMAHRPECAACLLACTPVVGRLVQHNVCAVRLLPPRPQQHLQATLTTWVIEEWWRGEVHAFSVDWRPSYSTPQGGQSKPPESWQAGARAAERAGGQAAAHQFPRRTQPSHQAARLEGVHHNLRPRRGKGRAGRLDAFCACRPANPANLGGKVPTSIELYGPPQTPPHAATCLCWHDVYARAHCLLPIHSNARSDCARLPQPAALACVCLSTTSSTFSSPRSSMPEPP